MRKECFLDNKQIKRQKDSKGNGDTNQILILLVHKDILRKV